MIDSFPIVPASGRGLWYVVAFVLLLFVGITYVLFATARGARNSTFEVSADGLRLRGDLYGRLIPAAVLRPNEARVVDLARESALAPRFRTFGTSVSSYKAGWFRLQNGEKALLYVTDRTRTVYIPTNAGYSVLLSPQTPDRFVESVRALGRG